MSIFNTNSIMPEKGEPCITRRVFFTGTGAVKKGQAVVWNLKPSAAQPGIGQCVQTPTSTLKYFFAGVAKQAYPANANGQWIDIYLPGSVCQCLIGPAVTAANAGTPNATVVFAQNGLFGKVSSTPETGCGTAIVLEANASAATSGVLKKCILLEGTDAVAPAFAAS